MNSSYYNSSNVKAIPINVCVHGRRWVLKRLQKEPCCSAERCENTDQIHRVIHEEMKVCADAASRYSSNYNAWSHRIWVLQHMASDNLKVR